MKKLAILLACALMLPAIAANAKKDKVSELSGCYVYGQSNRNSQKKGCALSLTQGTTFSLAAADQKDIDVMLFFGKLKGSKVEDFNLFAPNDPTQNISWDEDSGTKPFNKYVGKSDEPDAEYALKNWKTRNATKLSKVSMDFDNVTNDDITNMTVPDTYIAKDVKEGDVIAFQLAETSYKPGRKGLMKIVSIVDDETKPDKKGQGKYQKMIIDVKYVK